MSRETDYVSIQIRLKEREADPADPYVQLLSRILKRPPDKVCSGLTPGPLTFKKVYLNDDLKRLIVTLNKNGFVVRVFAIQPLPAPESKSVPVAEHTENRTLKVSYSDNVKTDWKKGEVIDGLYEVHGSAAGGMGRVYFVFHRLWNMMLAMKTPQVEAIRSVSDLKRFLREAEYWVHLGLHPNIATCYYARVLNGLPRMFIEYVDGGNLKDWADDNKNKDVRVIVDLMLQFCHGMIHAEEHGMIHRDIKPANCLMTRDGMLKITDFGLVKRVDAPQEEGDEGSGETSKGPAITTDMASITQGGGKIMGSPWYMAPERYMRDVEQDIRSDIYSFGVMLFEITCDTMPFSFPDGFSLEKLVRNHVKKPPDDPLSIRPDLPRGLVDIILTCLEKKPENRYSSFVEVSGALDLLFAGIAPDTKSRRKPNILSLKADSLNNQAASLLDLGRTDEAIKLLEEAQSADTEHLQAVYNLYTLRWERSEVSDREVVARMNSLKIEVRHTPDFQHLLGLIMIQRGEPAEGIPLLSAAAKANVQYSSRWEKYGGDPQKFVDSMKLAPIEPAGSVAGHLKTVLRLSFSPDRDKAYSVGEDRFIRTWDMKSGRCIKNIRAMSLAPAAGAFSWDGRLAATGYGESFKTLDLWDLETGSLIRKYPGQTVLGVVFSRDASKLLIFDDAAVARVFDTGSDKILWESPPQPSAITCADFLPDGVTVVLGHEDGSTTFWSPMTDLPIRTILSHDGPVTALKASHDGQQVATGGYDEMLRLWDTTTGEELAALHGHRRQLVTLDFLPEDKYLLSGSLDGDLKIWRLADRKCCRTFGITGQKLSSTAISTDGARLLIGGARGAVAIWSLDTGWFDQDFLEPAVCRPKTFSELRKLYVLFKRAIDLFNQGWLDSDIRAVMESFDQVRNLPGFSWSKEAIQIRNLLVKGSEEAPLMSWAFIRAIPAHEDEITGLDTAPDSLSILTGSLDGVAALWDVVTGSRIRSFTANSPIYEVFLLSQSQLVCTWSEDHILRIWDLDGVCLYRIEDVYRPIAPSLDGRYVLGLAMDGVPIRIEASTGKKVLFGAPITEEGSVCVTADWDVFYCIQDDVRVRRIDRNTGHRVGALRDAGSGVTAVRPLKSGDRVLTGMDSGDISLYLVGSGMDIATMRGHVDSVRAIDESPHGDMFVTGSDDFDVRLWDIPKETCLATLQGHSFPVRSVRFFPNNSMIASGSSNGKVRIWGLEWELSRQRLF